MPPDPDHEPNTQPSLSGLPSEPTQPSPSENTVATPTPVPNPTTTPQPVVLDPTTTSTPPTPPPEAAPLSPQTQSTISLGSGARKRGLLLIVAGLVVLFGGSAAAYFGYYMNPSVLWSQSLSNTGKGYDKLISYTDTQRKMHYKGFSEDGSLKLQSGGTSFSGTITSKTDGSNATGNISFDAGSAKVTLDVRSLKPAGANSPDVYVQLSGIKSLAQKYGTDPGPTIDGLDGQWVVIDHTLIDNLQKQVTKSTTSSTTAPSGDYVIATARSLGDVTKQYVFSTKSDKAVTHVVKNIGKETQDGRSVYHYKVGFNKDHLKAYLNALCTTFKTTKVGQWVKAQNGSDVDCTNAGKSADDVKTSDTIDVWVDTATRLVRTVRFSDSVKPSTNYADIGLAYNGGNSYPFVFSLHDKTGSSTDVFSLNLTLDSKANSADLALSFNSSGGSSPFTMTADLKITPSNDVVSVTAPAGAKPLADILQQLGLSPLLGGQLGSGANSAIQNPLGSLLLSQ